MSDYIPDRDHCLLYEFNRKSNAAEAAKNLRQTYGENSLSDSQCRKWFARFRSGDHSLQDLEGRGRPGVLHNDVLRNIGVFWGENPPIL